MTKLSNGTTATDLDNASDNQALTNQGYTIRCIETYHDRDIVDISCFIWDAPAITESDLPF